MDFSLNMAIITMIKTFILPEVKKKNIRAICKNGDHNDVFTIKWLQLEDYNTSSFKTLHLHQERGTVWWNNGMKYDINNGWLWNKLTLYVVE